MEDYFVEGPSKKRRKTYNVPVSVSSEFGTSNRMEKGSLENFGLTTNIPFQFLQNSSDAVIHNIPAQTQILQCESSASDTTQQHQPLIWLIPTNASFSQISMPAPPSHCGALQYQGIPNTNNMTGTKYLPSNSAPSANDTLVSTPSSNTVVSNDGKIITDVSKSVALSNNLCNSLGTAEVPESLMLLSGINGSSEGSLILLSVPTGSECPTSSEASQFQSIPSDGIHGSLINNIHTMETGHNPVCTDGNINPNIVGTFQNAEESVFRTTPYSLPQCGTLSLSPNNGQSVKVPESDQVGRKVDSNLFHGCETSVSALVSPISVENGQQTLQTMDPTAENADSSLSGLVQKTQVPNAQNVPQHSAKSIDNMPFASVRKLILQYQQRLVILFHADKCQIPEIIDTGIVSRCTFHQCQTTKELLTHMVNCQAGKNCTYPLCSLSLQILGHWKHCIKDSCPICSPVKKISSMWQRQEFATVQQTQENPSVILPDINQNILVTRGVNDAQNRKKIFTPEELRQVLLPTLEKLYAHETESLPHKQPLDPDALQVPRKKFGKMSVKNPMDFSFIKEKLESDDYQDPWEYVEDVWLMFKNAQLRKRRKSRMYMHCTKLSKVFEQEIDPVMRSLGYCCSRKYDFTPQVLYCYGTQLCIIPRDAKYWSYRNSNVNKYGLFYERYLYCQRCFSSAPGDTVTLGDDSSFPQIVIKKEEFSEMTNDQVENEPFIECKECGRMSHKICVLHLEAIWPEGFTCNRCLESKGLNRKENKFTARNLPQTKLGSYVEQKVNAFLEKKGCSSSVTIRVAFSSNKLLDVKPRMRGRYVDSGELPGSFPYRAKAVFAFEKIDGVDVCFFGMHVHEYGSQCAEPNSRRVYIAFLDSVNFFQPKDLRTAVYQEIILAYLDYAKQLGYSTVHIWSVPPTKGEDYIFHCHPSAQKIPSRRRLQEWYKTLFDKGIADGIIYDYKDILKHATEIINLTSATQLPYFEGDFWPDFLEDAIAKEEKEKSEVGTASSSSEASGDCEDLIADNEPDRNNKIQKRKSNRKSKRNKTSIYSGETDLSAQIYSSMEKHKEIFFVVYLHCHQNKSHLPETEDPDPFINCEMMDGRLNFLSLSREKHCEFSSLRRAKYSTMIMLYELHNHGQENFVRICKICKTRADTTYHCAACDNLDLCVVCFDKEGHSHKMEKLTFDVDKESPRDQRQLNPRESRRQLSVQRVIQSLVHACQCTDERCTFRGCEKMKRILQHIKTCKKTSGSCTVCIQYIILCCYHAKLCENVGCPVLFCSNVKHLLTQQQLKQRLQQAFSLRRRIASMQDNTFALPSPCNSDSSSYGNSPQYLHSPGYPDPQMDAT